MPVLFFNKTEAGSSIYFGGHYGFVLSNWLRSLIGIVGLVFLLFISGLTIVIARFDNALPVIKNMFKRKPKDDSVEDDVEIDEDDSSDEVSVGDDAISKVIDDDDVVRAIFEPDDLGSPTPPHP